MDLEEPASTGGWSATATERIVALLVEQFAMDRLQQQTGRSAC